MNSLTKAARVCARGLLVVTVLLCYAGCARHETLSKQEAAALLTRGVELEREGQLLAAYRTYKKIEGQYETNDDVRSMAWDGAGRLRDTIKLAGTDIEAALERFRVANGKYPQSLAQIEHDVSKSTAAILHDFWYVRKSDSEFLLNDNLYGTVGFDLQ